MIMRVRATRRKILLIFLTSFTGTITFFWRSGNQNVSIIQYADLTDVSRRKLCTWNTPNTLSSLSKLRITAGLAEADQFQEELCALQTLRRTSVLEDHQVVLLFIDDGFEDRTHCGIGCRFLRLDMALWYAYSNQMSLHSIDHGGWEYTSAKNCPNRNHECYFQSLSSSLVQDWVRDESTRNFLNMYDAKKLKEHEKFISAQLWSRQNLDPFRQEHHFGLTWLKNTPALLNKSGCWVASQLLYYLLKPNNLLEKAIIKEKQNMKWDDSKQCVAVHVRHGWRSRFNSEIAMSDYMKSVNRFSKSKNILLITEDQDVIRDAEANFPEYNWLYTDYPRENKHDIGAAMAKGEVDPTSEALNALVNLFLSSECEYFVGRVNSTWFRLMIMLAYGKYGQMPPFDNLLEDWGHGGLRKWGFFGICTLEEMRKEVKILKNKFPKLVKMDLSKINL